MIKRPLCPGNQNRYTGTLIILVIGADRVDADDQAPKNVFKSRIGNDKTRVRI